MVLQKGALEIPFGRGLDESVRPEVLDPQAAMLRVEGLRSDQGGAYAKRFGLRTFTKSTLTGTTTGALSTGLSIHDYDQRHPVITDGERLYDYSTQRSAWVYRDRVPEVTAQRVTGMQAPPEAVWHIGDSAIAGGCRISIIVECLGTNAGNRDDSANTNNANIYVLVQDATTNAVLQGPSFLAQVYGPAGGAAVTLATVGNYAVITGWKLGTNVELTAWTYNLGSTPSAAPTSTVWESVAAGSYSGANALAVSRTARGAQLIYLYQNNALAWRHRWYAPASGTTYVNTITMARVPTTFIAARSLALHYDADLDAIWYVYLSGSSTPWRWYVCLYAWTGDGTVPTSTTDLELATDSIAAGPHNVSVTRGNVTTGATRDLWVTISSYVTGNDVPNNKFSQSICRAVTYSGGVLTATSYRAGNNVAAYSEPFRYGTRWYQWFAPTKVETYTQPSNGPWEGSQQRLVLCEVTTGNYLRPVANIAPGIVGKTTRLLSPVQVTSSATGVYETPTPVLRNATTTHLEVTQTSFVDQRRMQGAQFGDVLALSGGSPCFYDGTSVSEIGFLHPPSIRVTTVVVTGADSPRQTGTYSAFCIYERTDANGNIHRSDPSNIVTITMTGTDYKAFSVRSAGPITASGDVAGGVKIVLYATRQDETTFYRVTERPVAPGAAITFTGGADINELFYTQPGTPGAAVFRYAPPALRSLISHNGSLVGVSDDGRTLWFSGAHLPGEGPWFHPAFVAYIDDATPVSALASMDGRLYAFTRGSIWVLDGPGFSDNGDGGYAPPSRLAVDAGCINDRSVVVSPIGVFFESDQGIMLLTRAGETVSFGQSVQTTLDAYGTIVSATLVPEAGEVRFGLVDANDNSAFLSWDYRDKLWHLSPLPSLLSPGRLASTALVTSGGVPQWCGIYSDGTVAYELAGATFDQAGGFSQHTPTLLETAWIKVAGLQGFQRVWRAALLFAGRGASTTWPSLRVTLYADYDDTPTQTRTWTGAELAALPRPEVEMHVRQQRCTAIKVRVEELSDIADTKSLDLLGLRFTIGTKGKTPLGPRHR